MIRHIIEGFIRVVSSVIKKKIYELQIAVNLSLKKCICQFHLPITATILFYKYLYFVIHSYNFKSPWIVIGKNVGEIYEANEAFSS